MTKKQIVILSLLTVFVSACISSEKIDTSAEFPGTREEQRRERLGALGGGDGLLKFGGRSDEDENGGTSGIAVNSYLWRATLDTLSFMPFASADPFGGVIITDWYEDQQARGERFKMTILITSKALRSDAVKVSVFKQRYSDRTGWQDVDVLGSLAKNLENKILTRARQLRVAKE